MSTDHVELFKALAAEFHPSEVKQLTKGGRSFNYVSARVPMNRLDEVIGPENWWDRYQPGENSVICHLTIRLRDPEGGWREVTKTDAGAYAGMSDSGDDDKSGFSDAFKRAAVKFGVGRYLYGDGPPIYGNEHVPQQPAPPPAHAPGKNNLHPNKSGHHNGQYASPEDTRKYLDRLKEKVEAVNGQWGDHWMNRKTGELPNVPACQKELMSVFRADGHLVKWLVETGQIDQDALDKNGKASMLGRHAAIILTRDKSAAAAMARELDRYIVQTFADSKEAVYRKHHELRPDGWLEEQLEAAEPDRGDAYEPTEQDMHDMHETMGNA